MGIHTTAPAHPRTLLLWPPGLQVHGLSLAWAPLLNLGPAAYGPGAGPYPPAPKRSVISRVSVCFRSNSTSLVASRVCVSCFSAERTLCSNSCRLSPSWTPANSCKPGEKGVMGSVHRLQGSRVQSSYGAVMTTFHPCHHIQAPSPARSDSEGRARSEP